MKLKICGLTIAEQAIAIAQLGVHYLGFIGVEQSPRYLAPEPLAELIQTLRQAIRRNETVPRPELVGVFADASLETLIQIQDIAQFEILQLHGQESPEFCHQVKTALPQCKIWKAFRIRHAADLDRTADYLAIADQILLDAYHPHLLGGTGETIPWGLLQAFNPPIPWILAGGLNGENIREALLHLKPQGVDVSSGVERSPGNKDLDKVKTLSDRLRLTWGNLSRASG